MNRKQKPKKTLDLRRFKMIFSDIKVVIDFLQQSRHGVNPESDCHISSKKIAVGGYCGDT